MDTLNTEARTMDPSIDTLVALKPMKHGDSEIQPGQKLPIGDFTRDRLETLVRVRFVKVVPGAREVVVSQAQPKKVEPAKVEAQKGFLCEFPGCEKPGPYKTKLALASHGKCHKNRE